MVVSLIARHTLCELSLRTCASLLQPPQVLLIFQTACVCTLLCAREQSCCLHLVKAWCPQACGVKQLGGDEVRVCI